MMAEEKPIEIFDPEVDESTDVGLPMKVILFNDDWHTFEEVIVQLIKATKCTFEKARSLAFEVHVRGKAVVFEGPLEKCLKVSAVLEEIELHTQIEA